MNEEDQKVAKAIRSQLKPIGQAIEMVRESLSQGGRLLYVGAGTSGRLGVLDDAECPPTFGVRATMVQGIIAGGKRALWRAVEGAEDDREAGARAVLKASLRHRDIVCGITASGQTPFVLGALAESRKIGARSILITSHPNPALGPWGDIVIKAVVGPEVIAGSTRMKAGTATKMILNMISTGTMEPAIEAVRSLYSLQKAIILTPCWPRAEPTGGAGLAFPAGICSLITALTFFAILFS